MPNRAKAKAMHTAVLAQLNAEILTAGLTPTSLARQMDLNYGSFRKYLNGELEIHLFMVWDILEALQVSPVEFMQSVEALHARGQGSPKSSIL